MRTVTTCITPPPVNVGRMTQVTTRSTYQINIGTTTAGVGVAVACRDRPETVNGSTIYVAFHASTLLDAKNKGTSQQLAINVRRNTAGETQQDDTDKLANINSSFRSGNFVGLDEKTDICVISTSAVSADELRNATVAASLSSLQIGQQVFTYSLHNPSPDDSLESYDPNASTISLSQGTLCSTDLRNTLVNLSASQFLRGVLVTDCKVTTSVNSALMYNSLQRSPPPRAQVAQRQLKGGIVFDRKGRLIGINIPPKFITGNALNMGSGGYKNDSRFTNDMMFGSFSFVLPFEEVANAASRVLANKGL